MRKKILFIISLCLLLAGASVAWSTQKFLETPLSVGESGQVYEIRPGMIVAQVANELYEEGVLSHPRWFVWLAKTQNKAEDLKSGEYFIQPGTLPNELLDQFVNGKVMQHPIRFGEGWTFEECLVAAADNPKLVHKITSTDPKKVAKQIGITSAHPEGWLFPDTYYFTKGSSDIDVLRRAYRKMQLELNREWLARDKKVPYKTEYEALIMASIVESETGLSNEYQRVSGVYTRRLKQNMRLQADPTVIYGLGENYQAPLKRSDLQKFSPYNTYKIYGLPPTPIGLPSLAAIHAAMHPAPGDSLFFVATGEGGHYFSKNLEEHNRAVARYRAWQAAQKMDEE